jgi:hypothetical protein
MSIRFTRRSIRKAASYTVNPSVDACGTTFTNSGAVGAITFTLPRPTAGLLGQWYRFRGVVAQNLIVAAATAGQIITLNNLAAASVAMQTGGQIVGGVIEAECVLLASGVYMWAVAGSTVGVTYTVA